MLAPKLIMNALHRVATTAIRMSSLSFRIHAEVVAAVVHRSPQQSPSWRAGLIFAVQSPLRRLPRSWPSDMEHGVWGFTHHLRPWIARFDGGRRGEGRLNGPTVPVAHLPAHGERDRALRHDARLDTTSYAVGKVQRQVAGCRSLPAGLGDPGHRRTGDQVARLRVSGAAVQHHVQLKAAKARSARRRRTGDVVTLLPAREGCA